MIIKKKLDIDDMNNCNYDYIDFIDMLKIDIDNKCVCYSLYDYVLKRYDKLDINKLKFVFIGDYGCCISNDKFEFMFCMLSDDNVVIKD